MDPNIDARLKGIEDKVEKMYQILARMRRAQRHATIFRIIYWSLIILTALGALYFIQPYLNGILEAYTGVQTTQEQLKDSIPNLHTVSDILDQLKGIQ